MLKRSIDYVTVFIPTFNGEAYLRQCIEALINQNIPRGYSLEILITDSGSSDSTLDILNLYKTNKDITVDHIKSGDFGHGRTRQRAAIKAKGKYILFLTQDAVPVDNNWVREMIEPFLISNDVGCVFGKQIPRPDAPATIKREVSSVFDAFGPQDAIMIHNKYSLIDDVEFASVNSFFSDVNSGVRKELLIGPIPIRDVAYAEDQALAQDMLNKHYLKAYSPKAAVWHSHSYSTKEYYRRKFDEYTGLQEATKINFTPSRKELLFGWIKPTLRDWVYIINDRDYRTVSKLLWLYRSPIYNLANFSGKYMSIKHINNHYKREQISLEHHSKTKTKSKA